MGGGGLSPPSPTPRAVPVKIARPKFIFLEFQRRLYGLDPNPLSFASKQLLSIIQQYFRPQNLYYMTKLTCNSIPNIVPRKMGNGNSPLNQITPGNFLEKPLIETKTLLPYSNRFPKSSRFLSKHI